MITRLVTPLAGIARPALAASGLLLAGGSALAAAGLSVGWPVYLAGFGAAAVAIPALAARLQGRLGRFGAAAFSVAAANIVLDLPVVAMVTTFVLGLDAAHLVLMGYVMTPIGMTAALGINLSIALAGIAIVRSGPHRAAGWLVVVAALAEIPVELGTAPLAWWAVTTAALAVAFWLVARSLGPGRAAVPILATA